jgi:hypothetical protein
MFTSTDVMTLYLSIRHEEGMTALIAIRHTYFNPGRIYAKDICLKFEFSKRPRNHEGVISTHT